MDFFLGEAISSPVPAKMFLLGFSIQRYYCISARTKDKANKATDIRTRKHIPIRSSAIESHYIVFVVYQEISRRSKKGWMVKERKEARRKNEVNRTSVIPIEHTTAQIKLQTADSTSIKFLLKSGN